MKVLQNKETTLKNPAMPGEEPTMATYGDLLRVAINTIPQDGILPSDMRKRMRLLKAIETAESGDGLIRLEDNDAENLQLIVKRSKWGTVHEDIINMVDEVNSMKYESELQKVEEDENA